MITRTPLRDRTVKADLQLSAASTGFDLRASGSTVILPKSLSSVTVDDREGRSWLLAGSREHLITEVRNMGYFVREGTAGEC